jgi:serine/threonine kinase PknH
VARTMRPGDVFAGRYRLVVLLHERSGGRFWRAWDTVLARHVAMHLIPVEDERAEPLQDAARRSATVHDPHLLRVLDTDTHDGFCYVVNEWGEGTSLNNLVIDGPISPVRAAWLVSEVGEMITASHAAGVAHGRLVPENVLLDEGGAVKVIGFAVDAALHGLPPGRQSADVVDLAGVLYTALTGKWTGVSVSGVQPAPLEHGRPMRPRQVRAGVPRILDTLCDEVLGGHGTSHGYTSARAITDALIEYVGDPAAVARIESQRARDNTSPRLPRIQEPVVAPPMPPVLAPPEPEPEPAPELDAEETQLDLPPADLPPVAEETQAGVPVFFDHFDDVGWMSRNAEPAPPPPPFEEHPARPLFAPDPPEGRNPRQAQADAQDDSGTFWPWGDEDASAPADAPRRTPDRTDDEDVPGRTWLRFAGILAACLLVLVAVIYAFNRGRGGDGLGGGGDEPTGGGTSQTTQGANRVLATTADDFDPFGDPPEENPDSAALAVDGKPGTSWPTQTYKENLGPGGLKSGVGLLLDLGSEQDVSRVTVTFAGGTVQAELRTAPDGDAPTQLDQVEVAASGTATGRTLDLKPDEPVRARYVVVWLTSLPRVQGGFRGEIAEVVVRS